MAAEGDIIIQFTFTGEDGELVPDDATHVTVDESVTVIPAQAFRWHPNIVEVDCHDGVEKVERAAFYQCPSLRRVKMRGVTIVEGFAFDSCKALTDVECDKLEFIGEKAFACCESLRNINLPSVKIVEGSAFHYCYDLTDVKFGGKLERIGNKLKRIADRVTFRSCTSLERITIPLKDGIIDDEDEFEACKNLKHVDLVGGVHEFVAALPLDEWKNDMNAKINSINQILPNTSAGGYFVTGVSTVDYYGGVAGEKGRAVKRWIRSVLHKLVDYKQQHCDLLTAATSILIEELALPEDIVIYEVLPFLELPSCNWKDDKWHGWGKMMYADGRVYVGNWKDDKKHGWGEMTYADGHVYKGNWVDGKRHGEGKMTYADGRVYDGFWNDDHMHGWGEMTYADGRVYDGHWKDDNMHGWGVMTYADGTEYTGNWKDGFESNW